MKKNVDYESIKKAVEKWLENEGYPLEMEVAKKILDAGLKVDQNIYYWDDEDKKGEIDILSKTEIGDIDLNILIECKYSFSPYIVFRNPETTKKIQDEKDFQLLGRNANYLLDQLIKKENKKENGKGINKKWPIFDSEGKWGYSMVQTGVPIENSKKKDNKRKGRNSAYEALNQVSKGTYYLMQENNKKGRSIGSDGFGGLNKAFSIIVPVVVVDTVLFEVYLDKNGDYEINKIEDALIEWNDPSFGSMSTWVYEYGSFDKFINKLLLTINMIEQANIKLYAK